MLKQLLQLLHLSIPGKRCTRDNCAALRKLPSMHSVHSLAPKRRVFTNSQSPFNDLLPSRVRFLVEFEGKKNFFFSTKIDYLASLKFLLFTSVSIARRENLWRGKIERKNNFKKYHIPRHPTPPTVASFFSASSALWFFLFNWMEWFAIRKNFCRILMALFPLYFRLR